LGIYRSRYDIIANILHAASGKPKKTQIMYQANLSFKVLKRYLGEVIEASLVLFDNSSQRYMLTLKGAQYLDVYKEYFYSNRNMEKYLSVFLLKKKKLEQLLK
jgi:predicted transcriptional regulator